MNTIYLMSNEELQNAIVKTGEMVKSYGEKIPDALMAHFCELLKIQEKRARLFSIDAQTMIDGD
jgi:hypothetical protein